MFVETQEVMDYFKTLLETNMGTLGLEYIGYGDEQLKPKYPAAVVDGQTLSREIHGVHTFLLTFNITIWVYHAKLTDSHSVRTRKDLLLVSSIRELIHQHMTLDGNVIHGYVTNEIPGTINRRANNKANLIVGTRMDWMGIQETHWT